MAQSEVREVMGKPERSEGYSWGSAWLYRTAMTSGVYGTEDTDFTIANGARVNEEDSKGQSPLDGALTHQRTETAVVLRKHGGKSTEELKAEGK